MERNNRRKARRTDSSSSMMPMVRGVSGMVSPHRPLLPQENSHALSDTLKWCDREMNISLWSNRSFATHSPLATDQGCPPNNNVADWHDLTLLGRTAIPAPLRLCHAFVCWNAWDQLATHSPALQRRRGKVNPRPNTSCQQATD